MRTKRFLLGIWLAVSACFALPAMADLEGTQVATVNTGAGFTLQSEDEMQGAIALFETSTEQSPEAVAIGPGISNSTLMYARTDSTGLSEEWGDYRTIWPDGDGKITSAAKVSTCAVPFEVGWQA